MRLLHLLRHGGQVQRLDLVAQRRRALKVLLRHRRVHLPAQVVQPALGVHLARQVLGHLAHVPRVAVDGLERLLHFVAKRRVAARAANLARLLELGKAHAAAGAGQIAALLVLLLLGLLRLGLCAQQLGEQIAHRKAAQQLRVALLPALRAEVFVLLFAADDGGDVYRRLVLSAFIAHHVALPPLPHRSACGTICLRACAARLRSPPRRARPPPPAAAAPARG